MEICTKDMYLAAILVSYECPIIGTDRSDLKRQYFRFDRLPPKVYISDPIGQPVLAEVDTLDDIKNLFMSRKLFLLPSFIESLRAVKAYIYSTE